MIDEKRIKYSGRIAYLDSTRVIAILAVVLLHCSVMFLDAQGANHIIGSILNNITRFGVPCFVMISGALFLDERRNISIRSALGKYVKGIIWLIIIWNIINAVAYTVILPITRGHGVDIKIFIGKLIFSEGHMWFLYMIIWLYAITPILRIFVNHANLKYVRYFVVLGLAMFFTRPFFYIAEQFLPFNTSFLTWLDSFHADFVGGFTVYYITGWYLHNYKLSNRIKSLIYLTSVISIAIVIIMVNIVSNSQIDRINDNDNLLIYIYSCGVYIWLQQLEFPKWVCSVAPYVFGIYIIHSIFIFLFNTYAEYANSAVIYLIKWGVVCILSIGVTVLFSKVKYLNRLVKA